MASGKRTLKPIQMPGSVKQSFSAEQTPRLKEMTSVYRDQSTLKLHGNRMAVPPLKSFEPVATVREIKVNSPVKSACKSDSSSSTKSQDSTEKMELKEAQAKEKRLNQKIEDLNKIIADLKKKIKEKDKIITKANDLIKSQEEEFKSRLLKETQSHIQTKCLLDEKIEQLAKSQSEFKSLKEVHEQKVKNLEEQKEKDLLKLRFEKDKEIASRDEKLAKLKKQMADVLMGNSKERQQQLEELTRELSRMQEEIEALNFKLKSYRSKQKTSCPGCKDLTDEVNKMRTLSTSQDETIKELQVLCAKLEIQLETQDDLLKQWPQSPGRKPSKPP